MTIGVMATGPKRLGKYRLGYRLVIQLEQEGHSEDATQEQGGPVSPSTPSLGSPS